MFAFSVRVKNIEKLPKHSAFRTKRGLMHIFKCIIRLMFGLNTDLLIDIRYALPYIYNKVKTDNTLGMQKNAKRYAGILYTIRGTGSQYTYLFIQLTKEPCYINKNVVFINCIYRPAGGYFRSLMTLNDQMANKFI